MIGYLLVSVLRLRPQSVQSVAYCLDRGTELFSLIPGGQQILSQRFGCQATHGRNLRVSFDRSKNSLPTVVICTNFFEALSAIAICCVSRRSSWCNDCNSAVACSKYHRLSETYS